MICNGPLNRAKNQFVPSRLMEFVINHKMQFNICAPLALAPPAAHLPKSGAGYSLPMRVEFHQKLPQQSLNADNRTGL